MILFCGFTTQSERYRIDELQNIKRDTDSFFIEWKILSETPLIYNVYGRASIIFYHGYVLLVCNARFHVGVFAVVILSSNGTSNKKLFALRCYLCCVA